MTDEGTAKVAELVRDARIAMVTTIDSQGQLVSRPMGLQEVEFDGDLWFFGYERSDTVSEIAVNPRANVSFSSGDSWGSVTGKARRVRDRAKSEELWNSFRRGVVPRRTGHSRRRAHQGGGRRCSVLGPPPGGKTVQLISMVKSKITGERYSGGDSGTVEL